MDTHPSTDIADSDLKAVRQFLNSAREGEQDARLARVAAVGGLVPIHNGITRARMRSAAKRSN